VAADDVVASAGPFLLAEGPLWDAPRSRLLWVDIHAGAVHEGTLDGTAVVPRRVLHRADGMVGAVAVAADGTLLVAEQEVLATVSTTGAREEVARVVPAGEERRTNDGGTDPAGRFLIGTMSLGDSSEEPTGREVLVRLESDGSLTTLDDDLGLSNGLAWSEDGRTFWSTDTERQTVHVRDYDPATGATGERRPHLRLDTGHPDGCAADAEDHLWVAVFGAGEVRRYAPDGTVVATVEVPAPHTTSVAFAGDDLRTLVITTGSVELGDEQRRAHPLSGHLFAVRTDVPGLPVPAWRGLG
jgi:sugar lactone lactonase YvrE